MLHRSTVVLASTLLVLLAACGPAAGGASDGGRPGDDAGDAGDPDGGPAVDAGDPDGGCTDPACVPCEEGGTLCPEGTTCSQGACVDECPPDATACDGLLVRSCGADGVAWSASERCGDAALCRDDECLPVAACQNEAPPCCALPDTCGNVVQPFACDECRPIVRDGFCLSGACEPEPTTRVDVWILADANALSPADQGAVQSGVVTVYRGVDSVGRAVTCAHLLDESGGTSPHDAQDPTLNATMSKYFDLSNGTGDNVFRANVLGLPDGPGQAVVVTVYAGIRGAGRRVGRGCTDGLSLAQDGQYLVTLQP